MFCQTYTNLDSRLYRFALPTPLDNPTLVHLNTVLINKLGLADSRLDWQSIIAGQLDSLTQLLANHNASLTPLAMAYAGHQFGQWAGQLGDGRAILLTQVCHADKRYDLQLKGAGRTPYSRHGDGRAMIDSTVREYLCGHALNHLGVHASDAIGFIISDTQIARHHYEKAASLLRVSDCHIRLGHFEWVAMYASDYFSTFVDEMITAYYPHVHHHNTDKISKITAFLFAIAQNTATMIANWQLIGFSHGVMNTDNINITGTTLDFGPFGFMEGFNPTWINNHSDTTARYCYQNQPTIGHWNLATSLQHFSKLGIDETIMAEVLAHYEAVFLRHYHQGLLGKLGIDATVLSPAEASNSLVYDYWIDLGYRFLQLLQKYRLDYTNSFRSLLAVADNHQNIAQFAHEYRLLDKLMASVPDNGRTDFLVWANDYRHHLAQLDVSCANPLKFDKQPQNSHSIQAVIDRLSNHNPVYILRNHMAQKAIHHTKNGNFDEVARLFTLLSSPYQVQTIASDDDTRMATDDEQIAISCLS